MHPVLGSGSDAGTGRGVRVLMLQMCEMDETGVGIVAAAFGGVRGVVVRGSEVRCGGWDVESIRRGSAAAAAAAAASAGSTVISASDSVVGVLGDADSNDADAGIVKGWWNRNCGEADANRPAFACTRVVRFEMCATSCAIDAVRMILDRCPVVERVEFVGCSAEDTAFLECQMNAQVELERISIKGVSRVDSAGFGDCLVHNALWFGGLCRFEEKISDCIARTRAHMLTSSMSVRVPKNDGSNVAEAERKPFCAPEGYRKCIVIQGSSLRGFRDKWYLHMLSRKRVLWGQQ
ncbi:hypothetical protein HDU82_006427 [Entophlyctis luteolus]|nr:hypothetical protein HDU82_006427 [Entophlyctis luteolus]